MKFVFGLVLRFRRPRRTRGLRLEGVVNRADCLFVVEGVDADNIEIHSGLSLIAVVGNNMASRQGTAATIFTALAESHVNIRMIDQGSSEMNIIVGVDTFDYEKAISAIYYSFEA